MLLPPHRPTLCCGVLSSPCLSRPVLPRVRRPDADCAWRAPCAVWARVAFSTCGATSGAARPTARWRRKLGLASQEWCGYAAPPPGLGGFGDALFATLPTHECTCTGARCLCGSGGGGSLRRAVPSSVRGATLTVERARMHMHMHMHSDSRETPDARSTRMKHEWAAKACR